MMDSHTGKSRGFGFAEMANAEDGDKAIVALNGTLLDERALTVNALRPKKQQGSFRDQNARARGGGRRLIIHHPAGRERGGWKQGYGRTEWERNSAAGATSRRRGARVPENPRPQGHRGKLPGRGFGPSRTGAGPCPLRRRRQSPHRIPGLLRPLERRRLRHPHPEGSQGGVRKAEVKCPSG